MTNEHKVLSFSKIPHSARLVDSKKKRKFEALKKDRSNAKTNPNQLQEAKSQKNKNEQYYKLAEYRLLTEQQQNMQETMVTTPSKDHDQSFFQKYKKLTPYFIGFLFLFILTIVLSIAIHWAFILILILPVAGMGLGYMKGYFENAGQPVNSQFLQVKQNIYEIISKFKSEFQKDAVLTQIEAAEEMQKLLTVITHCNSILRNNIDPDYLEKPIDLSPEEYFTKYISFLTRITQLSNEKKDIDLKFEGFKCSCCSF